MVNPGFMNWGANSQDDFKYYTNIGSGKNIMVGCPSCHQPSPFIRAWDRHHDEAGLPLSVAGLRCRRRSIFLVLEIFYICEYPTEFL